MVIVSSSGLSLLYLVCNEYIPVVINPLFPPRFAGYQMEFLQVFFTGENPRMVKKFAMLKRICNCSIENWKLKWNLDSWYYV